MRETVLGWTIAAYTALLPFAWIALLISVVILLPMAAFRKTRSAAAWGLFASSYVIGITTWFLGAGLSFASFGWFGLIIGLLVFGVGVVPLGIVGVYFKLDSGMMAANVLAMVALTVFLRAFAFYLEGKASK